MPATALADAFVRDPVPARAAVPAGTSPLGDLIAEVERALTGLVHAGGAHAAPVAAALARFLGRSDLLTAADRAPAEGCYARNLLHAAADGRFSIWAMVWQPGQGSSIHDHSCWCVMGVHEGALTEETYRPDPGPDPADGAVRSTGRLRCGKGAVRALDPGADDIHRIVNDASGTAVSIHIYGFDPAVAASSVGRVYAAE